MSNFYREVLYMILYEYEKYLSIHYAKSTKDSYMYSVKRYFDYMGNHIKVMNAERKDIYNYIAYLDDLKGSTRRNYLKALKNFYNFLNRDLSEFLFEDIKVYDFSMKFPLRLFSHQCKALLNYYSDDRNRLIIYLFLTTGMRLSELEGIYRKDIDFENSKIRVYGKGRKERDIFISEKCKNMIQDYITGEKLFDIKKREIQYIVTNAIRGLGYKGSVHTLRHSFATIMYEETRDILLVQKLLGHASINSTQIYTHLVNDRVKEAVESNPLASYVAK